jgi:hypothetical protein
MAGRTEMKYLAQVKLDNDGVSGICFYLTRINAMVNHMEDLEVIRREVNIALQKIEDLLVANSGPAYLK